VVANEGVRQGRRSAGCASVYGDHESKKESGHSDISGGAEFRKNGRNPG